MRAQGKQSQATPHVEALVSLHAGEFMHDKGHFWEPTLAGAGPEPAAPLSAVAAPAPPACWELT